MLVGYPTNRISFFEFLREWANLARRSKGSKNKLECFSALAAKEHWQGGHPASAARRDIKAMLEPAEFMTEQRYLRVTWLNIKQLQEPQASLSSSSLQARL